MNLNVDFKKINDMVMKNLPEREGLQATVLNAMHEAVDAGGKRIRPILMYETYMYFCKKYSHEPEEEIIGKFMAGMEIMHTASLIHDDLPCMDNDRLRRGKPTTWVVYGVDMATLSGDAMMIQTFSTMSEAAMQMRDPKAGLKAVNVMGVKAGIFGMTGGQVVDVENTGRPLSREQLDFIYRLKTGALLEASMMIGAILAGADDDDVTAVEKIAGDIGMAFQIRDDVLDEISTDEKLGKPVHSDKEEGKTTFVTLYGIDKANEEVARCSAEAIGLLEKMGGDNRTLIEITRALIDRDN
ncbi:MAG: polyprenyl synthetase family protein [Lachnospiraceae bacterium]|nr:polyprenyl synthetase family protein [Lachnospiraceae bacterium]